MASSLCATPSATRVAIERSKTIVRLPLTGDTLTLPKDEAQLTKTADVDSESINLALEAELHITGRDSKRVAFSTHKLFEEMLHTLQESATTHTRRSEDEFTRAFHSHLTSVLSNQTNIDLIRSPSVNQLLVDFVSAEEQLAKGIEPYLQAMRQVLRHSVLQDVQLVEVAMHEYNYSLPRTTNRINSHGGQPQPRTLGSILANIACSPCMLPKYLYRKQMESVGWINEPLLQQRDAEIHILRDVTLHIKPARLTLVLGPPGSGKTSLLRALSGKLLPKTTTGALAYNGRAVSKLKNLANWAAYVSQSDDHMPLLTVRETITHAFKCRKEIRFKPTAGLSSDQTDMLEAYKQLEVDVFLAVLGLTRCADTVIGNETLKGVSGGEKRRVTLGEMLAVGSQVLCLDEISTGLDSAATFDICQYLRHIAHLLDTNVVVSLLQPAPEVMDLFDDIIVLAEGQILFHGPREACQPYFESLGFRLPERKDIGDFLQELATPYGAHEFRLADAELAELGISATPPRNANEFAQRWKQSAMFQQESASVLQSLAQPPPAQDIDSLPQNSVPVQVWLAVKWSWTVRMKDMVKLKAKLVQNVAMGLLFGTLFYQIPHDQAYQKNILFLQVLMISSQSAITEVQTNARARGVYHKHIDQNFYRGWMLALAQSVTTVPLVVLDTIIFGQLIYWLTGLAPDALHFALFCLVSVLFGSTMQSIMGLFPYVFRDEMKGTVGAGLVLITSVLLSGVVATADIIPSYLMPGFYINPLAYAFRAMANVEFLSEGYDDVPCAVTLNGHKVSIPMRCGDFYLKSRQIASGWDEVYFAVAVLCAYMVVFWFVTAFSLTWVRFDPIPAEKKQDSNEVFTPQPASAVKVETSTAVAPQEQISLAVCNLGYTITRPSTGEEVELLSGVSMWALPGRMLALMGSSGAGKTTLLDVLAGVKTQGKIRGGVFLNGRPSTRSEFNKLAGYVQQFGIHNAKSTVRESLLFSMLLRLGEPDAAARTMFLDEIIHLLELDSIQDVFCEQLSMEQNKRVTLGVELVANPSIVFADEPTSSLDARAAAIVIRVLRRVAQSGRTVIATIHQPSTEIFSEFDDLLLLRTGGRVAYFGPAKEMVSYFDPYSFAPFEEDSMNPAAWMLEVIGGGTGMMRKQLNSEVDFADVYRESELCAHNAHELEHSLGISPQDFTRAQSAATQPLERFTTEFKTSKLTQFRLVRHRNFQTLWRTPDFTFLHLVVMVLFGAMFASLFFQQEMHNMADVQSRILCITFSMSLASMFVMLTLTPFLMNQRALFYRERGSGMYHSTVFITAFCLAELPFLIINTTLIVFVIYFGVGFNLDGWFPFVYFGFASVVYLVLMTMVGVVMSSVMPEPLSAQLACGAFFSIMNIFAGISVPINNIPRPYHVLHYLSPLRWFYEGLLSTQFHGNEDIMCNPLGLPIKGRFGALHLCSESGKFDLKKITGVQVTIEHFVLHDFLEGFEYEKRWDDVGVLFLWILGLMIIAIAATNYISYDNR